MATLATRPVSGTHCGRPRSASQPSEGPDEHLRKVNSICEVMMSTHRVGLRLAKIELHRLFTRLTVQGKGHTQVILILQAHQIALSILSIAV